MNGAVAMRPDPGAVAGREAPKAATIAKTLSGSHETHLRPWRLAERVTQSWPRWAHLGQLPRLELLRRPDDRGDIARDDAQQMSAMLPPSAVLDDLLMALDTLSSATPDARQTRLLIALMIDGFPAARPHSPEAYVETLVHEVTVSGYVPAVVAKACRTIAQTMKFPPAASELLAACNEAQGLIAITKLYRRALERRRELDDLLAEAARLGPLTLDDEWRTTCRLFQQTGRWFGSANARPGEPACRVPAHILAEFGLPATPSKAEPVVTA